MTAAVYLAAAALCLACALGLLALALSGPRSAGIRLAAWIASVLAVALVAEMASNGVAGLANLRDLALSLRVLRHHKDTQPTVFTGLRAVRHDEY